MKLSKRIKLYKQDIAQTKKTIEKRQRDIKLEQAILRSDKSELKRLEIKLKHYERLAEDEKSTKEI